jgi:hypothetical protein
MPPKGMFEGDNFMTPNVRGYYKLRCGYAELSEGTGMSQQPIFGVTIRPDTEKRSKLFQSNMEALDYIEDLS